MLLDPPRSTACLNLPHLPLQPQYAVVRWRWPGPASVCRYRCCAARPATTSARKTTKARYRGSPSSISRPTSQHSVPWIPMPGHSALTPDSHPSRSSLMNLSLPEDVLDQMALEQAHFDAAPQAFFEAWKRGAQIAGHEWFGDGTREGLQRATTKWDLRPNMLMLNDALGVLSSGQRMFLSAMVSFYNSREGGAMLKRCGFEELSDFGGLDLERRQVIADLTLHYNGW
ncbi:conserved hypothetical protein [Bordetella parapertussis Bpp5]|uniref:Uncharacterized protein n=2 Tax=Bordetella parapertussis TaxID=519 RepID=K0MD09_BORPB|nr:conserved hypothetical protein [Bordetella parapertussis Bpp5]